MLQQVSCDVRQKRCHRHTHLPMRTAANAHVQAARKFCKSVSEGSETHADLTPEQFSQWLTGVDPCPYASLDCAAYSSSAVFVGLC